MSRNVFAIVMLSLFLAIPVYAQWEIGGIIDINLASLSVDPEPSSEEYSSRIGLGIGGVIDRELTPDIDLHLEPMYLQKGGKIEEAGSEATFKVHYLEIPVLIRYSFKNSDSAHPYVMAGPSFGYLLSAKADIENGPEQDEKDNTKSLDFGVAIGGGVSIPSGNKTFFAEIRYLLGLSNINDTGGESEVKNRGIILSGGVTFPIVQ